MTDQEMITRCKKGDREAFNELMIKYQKQVFNMAYSILSDYEDASDASQEVFVKVYRSIASFRGQSAFTTWLYTICRNVCNDALRKRQRKGFTISIDSNEDENNPVAELPSEELSPEEHYEMSERQRIVRDAIRSLSPEYREIIMYSDMEQLSYDEIARILKCPNGTVKSRLNRARNALKKKLSEKKELF
ncbi:MAG: sigma-70 family RNA polymerase sigma factor [Clostridiales bacterium]|nr:sigma-70 family RNA polymerase sigma factor [Clostridiales bacterium]